MYLHLESFPKQLAPEEPWTWLDLVRSFGTKSKAGFRDLRQKLTRIDVDARKRLKRRSPKINPCHCLHLAVVNLGSRSASRAVIPRRIAAARQIANFETSST